MPDPVTRFTLTYCGAKLNATDQPVTFFEAKTDFPGGAVVPADAYDALLASHERLRKAAEEALCWLANDRGDGRSPEQRGAKCDFEHDAAAMLRTALAQAPAVPT